MPPHRPVESNPSFPRLDEAVLERWRERDIFAESLRRREGADRFVFYEGPPTVNGPPGAHHVLARVLKDIFPRYKTMRGYGCDSGRAPVLSVGCLASTLGTLPGCAARERACKRGEPVHHSRHDRSCNRRRDP